MHNRYTESARRVLFFARREASQLGSASIHTEHLLFGITQESPDAIRRHLKLDAADLRKQFTAKPVTPQTPASSDMPLDREAKIAIASSIKEAKRLGRKSIGAEHLLLGIMREDQCAAAKALMAAGAPDFADVRKSISESH